MIRDQRSRYYQQLVLALIAALLLGSYFGYPFLFVAVTSLGYLLWLLIQQHRLIGWLVSGSKTPPPDSIGLWGVVFDHLYRSQRQHQQQIEQYQDIVKRFRSSTEALADGIILLDHEGVLQWWNSAATQLLKLQSVDRGQPLTNLIRDPSFFRFFHKKGERDPLTLVNPADESQRLQISLTVFGAGEHLLLVRDVTRLHQLELMREDFVANASHELKTPLTVLRGQLENILSFAENLPPAVSRALTSMETQTLRMTNLVEDLLLLTRLDSAEASQSSTEINMMQLMQQAVEDGRSFSDERQHQFDIDCQSEDRLRGNIGEIRAIVNNLVVNAVNYSPPKSKITLSWHRQGRGHLLTVADEGIGIERHHLPRLTERFYRVDAGRSSATGGTGLGLAIVKHALQRHQGQLLLSSELHRGSQFSCLFPAERIVAVEPSESALD